MLPVIRVIVMIKKTLGHFLFGFSWAEGQGVVSPQLHLSLTVISWESPTHNPTWRGNPQRSFLAYMSLHDFPPSDGTDPNPPAPPRAWPRAQCFLGWCSLEVCVQFWTEHLRSLGLKRLGSWRRGCGEPPALPAQDYYFLREFHRQSKLIISQL